MKISILGTGNVGSHLLAAWKGKTQVMIHSSRRMDSLPADSDIYVIAVSDNAIREVADKLRKQLPNISDVIVAHTSGTTSIDVLTDKFIHCGVIYPMQTFTKDKPLDYRMIPFFIEGNDDYSVEALRDAARLVSDSVRDADSVLRRKIHLSSVISCNFVNHLWSLSDSLLKDEGLDITILRPLIQETVGKLSILTPHDAQTGPARRGDLVTISSHLQLLEENPQLQEIYRLISENIYNEYNN